MGQALREPLEQLPDHSERRWREIEYIQLNETGRSLYAAFFTLATMTFTWNASLGAAYGFLFFNKTGTGPMLFNGALAGISAIAVVYNLGAGRAYSFIFGLFHNMSEAFQRLNPDPVLQIPPLLKSIMTGKQRRGRGLDFLNTVFFTLLTGVWLSLFCYPVASIAVQLVPEWQGALAGSLP